MEALRHWSVRHSRGLNAFYTRFESLLVALDPLFRRIGYQRLERPVALLERGVKGLLFDCRMCGQCVLSSTGMSCPMNCPKNLRNGPCGGVRLDGRCEVKPQMRCVWVQAIAGSTAIPGGAASVRQVQPALDRRLTGKSSWLRVARERAAQGGATSGADPVAPK
ncbi:MAG: methylenetetrahydrofolate reductase C-terminal domain-containing protein [Proteobacteria bacterium]|nr:methylenetetrahydrofolate reductase C-terminal domain-containing protein [Pseudomonadota bacterium]